MSKEIRRLHRQRNQFTNFSNQSSIESSDLNDSENITASSNLTESAEQNEESDPQTQTSYFSPLKNDGINSIRAELREDTYHSEQAGSDFSDDTHDWGGDSSLISEDYWHYVGSFE